MKRNIKVFALALVAIGAMSVAAASAASAATFQAETYPTTLTGTQIGEHVFQVEQSKTAKSVTCPVAKFTGSLTAASEEVKGVTAEYKGEGEKTCKAFGLNATVNMNGCTYTFKLGTEKEKEMKFEGTADLVCPEGKSILVVTATCEVQIGAQTGLGPVNNEIMTNTPGSKNDGTVNPAIVKKIKYNKTKDGIGCPLEGTGVETDGGYVGTTTIKGENPTTLVEHELSIK